ncbi:MAG TPA: septum site-determining protein MinC [Steroidobacteraceae bacterium]|nr:septum site-determining protein MinC [Steroidobacteraceae bacterium]
MSRAAELKEEAALEIRFGPLDLAQVRIHTTDPGAIVDELTGRVATAPRFFERTAVGIDLSMLHADPQPPEMRAVVDAVRRAGMLPVGLVQGPACVETLARSLDLPVLPQFRSPTRPPPVVQAPVPAIPVAPVSVAVVPEPEPPRAALIHQHPVRSGQRVSARHRDLIVTASVGAGAEVAADGCVHVYGALRGRAMAGAHGDTAMRVFCRAFYAELVSIAGVFRVFESLPIELAGHPVQAWLEADKLNFARLAD